MRIMILILLISLLTQAKADFFQDPVQTLKDALKDIIRPDELFKKITDTIKQIINVDKILQKLQKMISFEDIFNKVKSSVNFQEILNSAIKMIKQKVNAQQFLNYIKQPLQVLYKNRSLSCDLVCEKWYNYLCFLLMDCQKKRQEFHETMLIPAIILGLILICCLGAYIFSTLSNCGRFLKCLLLPVKVTFQTLQIKYRNSHRKLQSHDPENNELVIKGQSQNWVRRSLNAISYKFFKKKQATDLEHQDHEIQPPLTAQRLQN